MKKNSLNNFRSETGATAVEFSLIAALLFIIVLSLFEGSRYMTALGVLNAAADRAVAIAASEPDSRFAADQNTQEGRDQFKAAIEDLKAKLTERTNTFIASSFIGADASSGRSAYLTSGVVIYVPYPGDGITDAKASPEQALENRPVTISMEAEMEPLFPCFGALFNQKSNIGGCSQKVPIRVFAAAFKEPTKALTLPSPVDCQGRPLGSPDYNTACTCDPDKYWDKTQDKCISKRNTKVN